MLFEQHRHPNRRVCMLIITHECNLNCSYCYERFKGPGRMTVETAKEIILREIALVKESSHFSEIEVDFMGGEPFINFGLIKEILGG